MSYKKVMEQNEKLKLVAKRLKETKEQFFTRWQESTFESKLKYPNIINRDILEYGSKIFDRTVANLATSERLHKQRIVQIGKEIGFEKALAGGNLEAVLDLYILFKYHLWQHLRNISNDIDLSGDDVFEMEKRINLYIDHIIESIAFSYVSTKERAIVDLIEKLIT